MIAIIQEQFEHNIANNITRFLEHPTAPMIRRFREYTDLLAFDSRNASVAVVIWLSDD